MLTLGYLFIHAPFQSAIIVLWSLFWLAHVCVQHGAIVVVCVSQSERKPTAFALLSADSGWTIQGGPLRRLSVREWGVELNRWHRGGVRAPMRTGFFCLSILMTQSRIKGSEMGQNSSQCGCTGVKHDQTTELNRGIIVPKMCVRERWRQKETELHYFHILSPTRLTMLALWPSSGAEFDAYFGCICSWPTSLTWKKTKIFVYQTETSETCTLSVHAWN